MSTVGSRVDPVTRAVAIRALIANEEDLLRPGMLMTVALIRSRESVLAVPEEALIPIQDKQYVYVVDANGKSQRVEVGVGRRRPGIAEITSGLAMTDRVVTEGMMDLRPGAPVVVEGDQPKRAERSANGPPGTARGEPGSGPRGG